MSLLRDAIPSGRKATATRPQPDWNARSRARNVELAIVAVWTDRCSRRRGWWRSRLR